MTASKMLIDKFNKELKITQMLITDKLNSEIFFSKQKNARTNIIVLKMLILF